MDHQSDPAQLFLCPYFNYVLFLCPYFNFMAHKLKSDADFKMKN